MEKFTKRIILLLAIALGFIGSANAQNRFWIGNNSTGDLTDGTKWSATLGGAAIGGTLTVTVGQFYIIDGTDLNGTLPGAGTGPATIGIAAARNPGQFIVRNGNVIVNITSTATNNFNIGSTSAASTAGDDFSVGAGCTLNMNANSHLYLNSTSNATTHTANIAGTVNLITSSSRIDIRQSANTNLTPHVISGTVNVMGSSSLFDFTAGTGGATHVNISGTINLNNTTTSAGRLNFTGTSTNTRITLTGTINVGGSAINLGTLTWGGSGTYNSPAGAFIINSPGVLNYNAAAGQTVLDDFACNNGGTVIYAGSGTKTCSIGHLYPGGKLSIQGTAATSGTAPTFTTSTSTLEYKGSSAQTAATTEWTSATAQSPWNVIIDNTSGVTLPFTRTIQGTLTLTNGALNVNGAYTTTFTAPATQQPIVRTSGTLTLASTAALSFAPASGVGNWTIPNDVFTSAPTFTSITANMILGNRLVLNNQNIILTTGFTLTTGIVELGSADLQVAAITVTSPSATKMFATSATSGLLKRSFTTGSFQSFDFPIGELVGTAEYNGFTFNYGPSSATAVIGWKVVDDIHPSMNTPSTPANYLSRYYVSSISPSIATYSYYADLPYNGTGGDIVGTESLIGAVRWNGSAWVGTEASVNATSDVIRFPSAGVDQTDAPLGFDVTGRTLANDAPCGATSVTPGAAGAGCTNTVPGNTLGATQTFSGGVCGTADDDVWFSFQATATSHTVRVTPSASFDAVLQAYYNAACASLVSGNNIGACADAGGDGAVEDLALTGLTIGLTYYVRVWENGTYASPPASNTFDICVITPPANDEPCGAVLLTANAAGSTTCTSTSPGNSALASQTNSSCNFTTTARDVWFRFVASATSHTVNVTGNGTFDPVLQVYRAATCSTSFVGLTTSSAPIASDDCADATGAAGTESIQLTDLVVGTTYYVRVYHATSTVPSNTSFTVCLLTAPTNDVICGATDITPVVGSCTGSTYSTALASQTNTSCGFTGTANDVWFRFTATASSHTVSVVGNGTFDPVLQLYRATNCSTAVTGLTTSTTPVASDDCADATGAAGAESIQLTGLTVGLVYYYRVYHASSTVPSNTTFSTCVSTPPANDDICGAAPLTANAAGSTTCTFTTGGDAALASQTFSSCGFTGTARDVWFRFTATATSHTVRVTGNGTFDPVLQLYRATNCSTAVTALTTSTSPIASDDCADATAAAGTESIQLTGLTVGVVYYARVYHASSTVPSNTTFTVCLQTAPTNDNICGAQNIAPGATCVGTAGNSALASESFTSCGFTGTARDVWYSFTAAATSQTISVTGNGTFDPVIQLYRAATCSTSIVPLTTSTTPAASSSCQDATGAAGTETISVTGLTIGTVYYYRIYHAASAEPTNTSFTTCVVNPPANDNCASATSVTQNATCSTTAGTTVAASGGLNLYSGDDDDVWYTFVATGTAATIQVSSTGTFDAVLNLRDNTACSGVNMVYHDFSGSASGSNTETIRVSGLTSGQTYKVRVFSSAIGSGQNTFNICVFNYTPAGNDNISGAITASVGNTTGNSNATYGLQVNTTASGVTGVEPTGLNWFPFPNSAVNSQWFTFTPATTGCYRLAATGAVATSTFDSEIAIYTTTNVNNWNAFTEVASDEDGGPAGGFGTFTSMVNTNLTGGVTYYVQVSHFPYGSGTPTLRIQNMAVTAPVATAATGSPTCTGFTANWNAATNAASYQLDVATDAAFTSIVGSYNNLNVGNVTTYPVTGLTTGNNFYYRVRAVNACAVATANSNVITIDNTPAQPAAFTTSSSSVCAGASGVTYTVPNDAAVTYNWSYSGTGATINGTGNSVTVDFASNATSGTLSVTASECTITSAATIIAVTVTPSTVAPTFTAGATTICANDTDTYTATTTQGTITYSIVGGTGASINPTTGVLTSAGTTDFTVRATSTNGICSSLTADRAVTVTPSTVAPTFTSGATTLCIGDIDTYTATTTQGTISYSILGGTGAVINASTGEVSSVTGSFTVVATSTNSPCGSLSTNRAVTVTPNVGTPSFTAGATTLCAGATSTYTATASNSTGVTYSIFSGGATIDANTGVVSSVTSSFVVRVTATGTCGANTTADRSVTVNPLPGTVTATAGSGATPSSITANWNAAANATSYILEVSTVSNFASTVFNSNVGNVTTFTVNSGLSASTTYFYRVTAVNACGNATVSNTITYATTAPIGGFTWVGGTSTDWNTGSNWSGGAVPSAADDITIPNQTNDPVLSTGANGACRNVTISSGATLAIGTGRTIDVKGNWVGANNTISGAGNLIFSGTSAQTITGGATVSKLQINNGSGVTVATGGNRLNITTSLDLVVGQLNTNSNLTIKSSIAGQAYIDDFSGSNAGTITGNIIVERYIPASPNGFRYIGAPVRNGATTMALSNLGGSFVLSGTPGQTIPLPTCSPTFQPINVSQNSPYATFMYWQENGPYGSPACRQRGWWFQTTGNMNLGQGYGAKVGGNTVITYTGIANTGTITSTAVNTHSAIFSPSGNNGWNLVSNPFPSAIRIDETGANTDPLNDMPAGYDKQMQFYITTGTNTGSYQPIQVLTGAPANIALGQGFWVRVTNPGTTPPWTLGQGHRTTGSPTYFESNAIVEDRLNVSLTGNGFGDQTDINFVDGATPGFDLFDANKWFSALGQPTLFTKVGDEFIGINSHPLLTNSVDIPMGLSPGANGTFTFTFNDVATFPQSAVITLEDFFTDSIVDIRAQPTYTFNSLATDTFNRFMLHFQPGVIADVVNQDCDNAAGSITFTQNGTTVWDSYTVTDNSNNTYAQGNNYSGAITVNNLAPQEYIITLVRGDYTAQEFITVNSIGVPIVSTLAVSDTTVLIGEQVNFTGTATNATNYSWNFGDGNTAQGSLTQQHTYAAIGEYLVTFTAFNDSCSETLSQTVYVGTVGINNQPVSNLSIYGQGEKVVIQFNNWGGNKANITMYNTLGQRVESLTGVSTIKGRQELNVAGIIPGYYFIQVVSGDKVESKKVYLGNN